MLAEDLKQYDKKLRQIVDPFGAGFPVLRKLMDEYAREKGLSVHDLWEQHMSWKWRK